MPTITITTLDNYALHFPKGEYRVGANWYTVCEDRIYRTTQFKNTLIYDISIGVVGTHTDRIVLELELKAFYRDIVGAR